MCFDVPPYSIIVALLFYLLSGFTCFLFAAVCLVMENVPWWNGTLSRCGCLDAGLGTYPWFPL